MLGSKHDDPRDSLKDSTGTPQFQMVPESMLESPWSDYQKANLPNVFRGIMTNSPNKESCKD